VNEVISTGGEGEQEYKEIIKSLTDILDKSPNTKTQIKKKKAKKENRGQ